jgi:hypothetical protein
LDWIENCEDLRMKIIHVFVGVLMLAGLPLLAQPAARILSMRGTVQLRHGMDENWQLAAAGMPLEALDTILTGENSDVVIQSTDDTRLRLGANIILDISEIKRLSEREMFLWLMSQKIDQLPQRQEKTPLRFGQITSVHGEDKGAPAAVSAGRPQRWRAEVNGAMALLENEYVTNAVVKCHKILRRYPELADCGEVHFYLGHALESLGQTGQAIEAYRGAQERLRAQGCSQQDSAGRQQGIDEALQRLLKTSSN